MDAMKGLSRVGGHEEKTRQGSSTPNPETSTTTDQRKTEETDGCDEGTKVTTDEGAVGSEQSVMVDYGG